MNKNDLINLQARLSYLEEVVLLDQFLGHK